MSVVRRPLNGQMVLQCKWLGGGVIVYPGVTIGDNSVIGAGSVVTKEVPANVVAAGNPCRVIRALDTTI